MIILGYFSKIWSLCPSFLQMRRGSPPYFGCPKRDPNVENSPYEQPLFLRTSRVTLDVPYFLVGVSLSLGNEIGAEHQTRSCCRMKDLYLYLFTCIYCIHNPYLYLYYIYICFTKPLFSYIYIDTMYIVV